MAVVTKPLEAIICPTVCVIPRTDLLIAVSAESVMPEIAVHLRPTWSEECEEIICLFILHFTEEHYQRSDGSRGEEGFRRRVHLHVLRQRVEFRWG